MDNGPTESQAYLQAIMAGSPDPIFIKDRESRFLIVNPAALWVTGKTLQEVIGKDNDEVFDKAVAERLTANDRMVMESGESRAIEESMMTPDGPRTYLTTKSPFRNSAGEIIGVIGIARDITDRIQYDQALRGSEERMRLFVEHAPAALAMFDCRMRYISVSRRWIRDYGLEGRDLIGKSHYEVFPEISDYWREVHRRSLHGEVVRAEEDRFERADSSVQWLRWEVRPWTDSAGHVAGVMIFTEDITDIKRTTEALRQNRELLQILSDITPDAIYVKDRESRWLMANPSVLHSVGKSADEALGKNDLELFRDPESGRGIIENDHRVMERGEPETFEEIVEVPDGKRVFLSTKAPRRDENGNVIGIIGISRDITDRKRAEETLQRSEALLRSVLEQMPSGVTVRDARTGEVLSSNARIREILGDLAESPNQFDSYYGMHPDGRPYRADEWPISRSMATGEIVQNEEISCTRADGTPVAISVSSAPIRDSQGNIILGIGVYHDITERKRAEEALRDSEEKYRRLVETSNEGILQIGPDFRTIYINARMAQMLGYTPEEAIGRLYHDFTAPDEQENTKRRLENRSKGVAEVYECKMVRKDGSKFWALVSASPLHDRHGNWLGSLGMFTDIHKRKLMERALRALNETLEQRVAVRTAEARKMADQLRALATELSQAEQRERRRLAAILHDHIQQLLVAARLQLEWLGHEPEPERIKATTQGIDAILKEAIAAARSLTIDLSPPVLNQAGLVGGLSWLASRMLEKNQFTVHLRADTNAEPPTEEMRLLLFECVRELLFNATKHSGVRESDVTLMRIPKDRIRIVVQDLGKGFDPDRLRNRRPNEATFGLFSIQQRLAHIGGHVEIETGVGRGTKVTLTVQAGRPESKERKRGGKETPSGIDVRRKEDVCRVLIVDDHKILRDGLRGLLQFEEGIEVVGEAPDGPSGIELAGKLVPDVVIMDINLKEMSGIEATRAILEKNPQIKVIALSMHLDVSAARAMREAGAVAYVPKGGPSEDLIAAIRACVRDKTKTG